MKGIYVTLADVDESGRTTPLLEVMRQSLDRRRGSTKAAALADEIAEWLAARTQARNGDLAGARVAYDTAVGLNASGDNPATPFERARVWIGLKEYRSALGDLDSVVRIARRQPMPASTPTPPASPTSEASVAGSATVSSAIETARPDSRTSQPGATALPTVETPTVTAAVPDPLQHLRRVLGWRA